MLTNIVSRDAKILWHPYTQHSTARPVIPISKGKGAYLFDDKNKQYLDLISSWWVNIHGHCHPAIVNAISKQANQLEHVIFAGFTHEPAVQLGEKLLNILPTGFSKVFFSDNGSTAVEVALKAAYQYWFNHSQQQKKIFLAFEGGYHGDTFGAMAVGSSSGFYKPFEELLFEVKTIPFPYTWLSDQNINEKEEQILQYLTQLLEESSEQIAALIVEPLLQGSSGMRICRPHFIEQVLLICKKYNILTIFDEVLTGFGRTGTMFAAEQLTCIPDMICLSKGLTGGFLPLSATIVKEEIFDAFKGPNFSQAFAHGHSYTANPLACAAACAAIDLFSTENTLDKVSKINEVHLQCLQELSKVSEQIQAVRAIGALGAFNLGSIETDYSQPIGRTIEAKLLEKGLLLRPLGNCVYLMPPYCIELDELKMAYKEIASLLEIIFERTTVTLQ
jgi:adenosylmethionine---8-amino-7-oxononanoate aminotransferase